MKDNEGSDSKSIIRKYFRSTLFRERSKSFRQFESYVEYKMQQMGFKVMNPAKGQNVLFWMIATWWDYNKISRSILLD